MAKRRAKKDDNRLDRDVVLDVLRHMVIDWQQELSLTNDPVARRHLEHQINETIDEIIDYEKETRR